ncbi:MAG: DMT family transporter, partial [Clostridia bacterium]|nr:DMT family transporter [Clostridia bacterium]
NVNKNKRILSLVMLGAVALIWGLGFVLADELLADGFAPVPGLQNAIRFGVGTLLLVIVLWKHIKLTKQTVLYGAIGGALLFGGFLLQLAGQKYITPAHCGFFTALYFVMTPFFAWIVYKKAPHYTVFVAVALAVVGLVVLNIGKMPTAEETLGSMLTIAGATMFAIQIVFSDYLLKNDKIECNNLVVLQLIVASVLFIIYTLIFESSKYPTLTIQLDKVWWKLAIVALLGTGFAYYAQTYAQKHVSPTQTSLILACETPIGAIFSIMVGIDAFSWNIVVGGVLVVGAVFLVEFAPALTEKLRKRRRDKTK